jgi:tetratricopeptide (TPR) repeat protein
MTIYFSLIFELIKIKQHINAIILIIFCLSAIHVFAENDKKKEGKDSFLEYVELINLLKKSEEYYIIEDYQKGDSVFKKAIQVAEFTRDEDVILKTLFYSASLNVSENTTLLKKEQFIEYITLGINYAKLYKRQDYIAYGNTCLSEIYRKKGDLNNAQKYANLAFSTALNLNNDSCKVVSGIQLGKIYQAQKEMLLAFKTFTNAHEIASRCDNPNLLSMVYHSLASLYESIDKPEEAKDYYFKSLDLNTNSHNNDGIINDYISIGASYDFEIAIEYLEKARKLAVEAKNKKLEKKALTYIFSYLIVDGNSQKAFEFLNKYPVVKTYYENRGPFNFNWTIGEIYLYSKQIDSAKKYFDLAATYYLNNKEYDKNAILNFISEYSMIYDKLNEKEKAFELYLNAFQLSVDTKNYNQIIYNSQKIKELYTEKGDFKNALVYSELHDHYKDTMNLLMKEKEFASLEIENENTRIVAEKTKAELAVKRKHNIQYMGITIAICLFFTLLLFISGKNKVSERVVEIIGFFAFIFLFEFIILILDTNIHHLTHGSPLWIWLIKIVIISFLLPFHHYLEETVVHYLKSRKLIVAKEKFQWKKLFSIFGGKHNEVKNKPIDAEA